MKLFASTVIVLFSTLSYASPAKICKFPNMGNVPLRIVESGVAATVTTPDGTVVNCAVAAPAGIASLNQKLAAQSEKIGTVKGFIKCFDKAAISSFEIYYTTTSTAYFYMETQGRVSGTCE